MAYKIKNGYLKSMKVEKVLYENYVFKYSEDTFTKLLTECLKKAVENKDFFEFVMFDDVDDFKCTRSIIFEEAKRR